MSAVQGGCGLHYPPYRTMAVTEAAAAPVFFPDGYDGHGYVA